jgi:cobalamin biosynthesis protein CobD/CbiB
MFVYLALPAFWFFVLSFVFLSRIIIYQKALANYERYQSREEQRQALLRFYGFFYVVIFIAVIYFQHILISKWLTFGFSGFIWISQIINNVQNVSRTTPNMGFAIT